MNFEEWLKSLGLKTTKNKKLAVEIAIEALWNEIQELKTK